MRITLRDREILSRVQGWRSCDSGILRDLFPTQKALQQRLWRLTREQFLKVYRVGNQRAYSLARRGVQALGLSGKEVRVSRVTAVRSLTLARIRQELEAQGYLNQGQDQVGRVTVLRAWREGRQIAVTACDPETSPSGVCRLAHRLRGLVNPFGAVVDELIIFGPPSALRAVSKLPPVYQGRVTARLLPSDTQTGGRTSSRREPADPPA